MSSKGVATNSSGNSAANRMGKGIPPSSTGSADGPSSSSSSSYRTYGKSKKSWHDDYMRMSETLLLIDCSSICSTSSLNILLSCTKSNRIWVSNTSSAFFSDPDRHTLILGLYHLFLWWQNLTLRHKREFLHLSGCLIMEYFH